MIKRNFYHLIYFFIFIPLSSCDENPAGPGSMSSNRAFVLNSISGTISTLDLSDLTVGSNAIALGPNSTAVGFTLHGNRGVVPNGTANNVTVFDTETLSVLGVIDLSVNSAVIGSAFLNDQIAFVCNQNLNSISRIDLQSMTMTDTIHVGIAPSEIAIASGKVFVANSNLDLGTFQKLGNGTISVIDPASLQVTNTIDVGDSNSIFIDVDLEGDLIVINAGDFGAGNGTVSVIDPVSETLTAGPVPIGDFPGTFSINSEGIAYIASFSAGLYAFNTKTNTVVRGIDSPLAATDSNGNSLGSAGVAFDAQDNIYSVHFGDALTPGTVFIFDSSESLVDSVKVGIGPFAIEIQ